MAWRRGLTHEAKTYAVSPNRWFRRVTSFDIVTSDDLRSVKWSKLLINGWNTNFTAWLAVNPAKLRKLTLQTNLQIGSNNFTLTRPVTPQLNLEDNKICFHQLIFHVYRLPLSCFRLVEQFLSYGGSKWPPGAGGWRGGPAASGISLYNNRFVSLRSTRSFFPPGCSSIRGESAQGASTPPLYTDAHRIDRTAYTALASVSPGLSIRAPRWGAWRRGPPNRPKSSRMKYGPASWSSGSGTGWTYSGCQATQASQATRRRMRRPDWRPRCRRTKYRPTTTRRELASDNIWVASGLRATATLNTMTTRSSALPASNWATR